MPIESFEQSIVECDLDIFHDGDLSRSGQILIITGSSAPGHAAGQSRLGNHSETRGSNLWQPAPFIGMMRDTVLKHEDPVEVGGDFHRRAHWLTGGALREAFLVSS